MHIGTSSECSALQYGPFSDSGRPLDAQIHSLALSNWDEFGGADDYSIWDLVYDTAVKYGSKLAKHHEDTSRGQRRLKKYVRFKRASVHPRPP